MREIARQALSSGLVLTRDQNRIFNELAARGPIKARRLAIANKMGGGVFTEVVKIIGKLRQIFEGKVPQVGVINFGYRPLAGATPVGNLNASHWFNEAVADHLVFVHGERDYMTLYRK